MPNPQAQIGMRGPYQDSTYALFVIGLVHQPVDSTTYYLSANCRVPCLVNEPVVYIRDRGTIKRVEIMCYAATIQGSNEPFSMYLRMNDAIDYLIATVGISNRVRPFFNIALNVPVVPGDFFSIKFVTPAWVTNPTDVSYGGYVYIE